MVKVFPKPIICSSCGKRKDQVQVFTSFEKVHTHTQPGGLGVQGNFLTKIVAGPSVIDPGFFESCIKQCQKNVCTSESSNDCPCKESRWCCQSHWMRSELDGLSVGGQVLCRSWSANWSKLFSSTVEAVAVRIMMRAQIKIQVRTCKSKSDWWKASGKFEIFLEAGMPCWLFINSRRMKKKTLAIWFKKLDFCWTVTGGVGIWLKAWRCRAVASRRARLWRVLLRLGMASKERYNKLDHQLSQYGEAIWNSKPNCIP